MFNNQVIAGSSGQGGGFYDFPIEQSLRFNDNDSAYLSRTPASTGNRKTWTWSGWVKRGNLGTFQALFSAGLPGTTYQYWYFNTDDTLRYALDQGGSRYTTAVFRDTSAWMNIIIVQDTTDSTASDRIKIYVNGDRVTSFTQATDPALNSDGLINSTTYPHNVGKSVLHNSFYLDGYMADVNFIDGQALDPTSFGELKSGIWVPVDTADLTFGTNGFRLQFGDTTEASGFNAVTYTGNGSSQSISGVGFSSSPDLVWIKQRDGTEQHQLFDTVRGAPLSLSSSGTFAENNNAQRLQSFNIDGFTLGNDIAVNQSAKTYVGWAWDAGSGSASSNTDGSITSTVKANTDYGFSITSYTGNGSAGATVGHSLGVQPDMIIVKSRDNARDWRVYHSSLGATYALDLNTTLAVQGPGSGYWNSTEPTSSVFSVGSVTTVNGSGEDYIAYCFAEKTGFSKISTYTGTGAAGNSITLGFKPAFLLIKETGNANSWELFDNTRNTSSPFDKRLFPNTSAAEATTTSLSYSDTGFETLNGNTGINRSGGTYVYMAFADTRDAAFWRDTSGQGNDWQPNNLVFSDVVPDSTTNNFGTWNPLVTTTGYTFSEGNLKALAGTSDYGTAGTMFTPKTGKWYFEFCNSANGGTSGRKVCGVASSQIVAGNDKYDPSIASGIEWGPTGGTAAIYGFRENGDKCSISATTAYGSDDAQTVGDVVGVALDLDNSAIYFSVNGVWQNSGDPTSGASQTGAAFTGLADDNYTIMMHQWDASHAWTHNGGQDSTFANVRAAGGNADENGLGDFAHPVPSGFLSLCSSNLPTGAIDTLNDETPEDYFNTVLYTGNGSTQSITGVGFQPSLTWIKSRSNANSHELTDAVRGVALRLLSDETDAESAGKVSSFDSDGFSLTADGNANRSSYTYASWNWKAGGTGVSNTDGSITSTVSVGATSQQNWFSVVGYQGNGTAGATVGHGLGVTPSMLLVKDRSATNNWQVFTETTGNTAALFLNLTAAVDSGETTYWNNTSPTSSVFSIGTNTKVNTSGRDYICYAFANAEGLCKMGKYGPGTGNSDGPFVYTGFRPAFILVKGLEGTINWAIRDNERLGRNPTEHYLIPDLSNAESSASSTGVDFLSNGFKFRGGSGIGNLSGANYIYLAIAEQPFKYANAR